MKVSSDLPGKGARLERRQRRPCRRLAWWKTTAKPSISRRNSGRTASGVTSRGAKPVPPVVMITSTAGSADPDAEPGAGSPRHRRGRSPCRRARARPARQPLGEQAARTCRSPRRACRRWSAPRCRSGWNGRLSSIPGIDSLQRSRSARSRSLGSIQRAPSSPVLPLPEHRLGLQPVHQHNRPPRNAARRCGAAAATNTIGLAGRDRAAAVDDVDASMMSNRCCASPSRSRRANARSCRDNDRGAVFDTARRRASCGRAMPVKLTTAPAPAPRR